MFRIADLAPRGAINREGVWPLQPRERLLSVGALTRLENIKTISASYGSVLHGTTIKGKYA